MRPARSSTLGEAINICELHVKVAKGVDRRDVSNVLLHAVKSGCSSVVEHHVANVRVVSSNLITRSEKTCQGAYTAPAFGRRRCCFQQVYCVGESRIRSATTGR